MGKKYNLLNKKFGKLTATGEYNKHEWLCLCDCGETTHVHTSNLVSGRQKSCGCLRPGSSKKDQLETAKLICEGFKICSKCKKKKEIKFFCASSKMKTGLSSSCKECDLKRYKNKRITNPYRFKAGSMLHNTKAKCKKDKILYDLDLDFVEERLKQGCPMTGLPFDINNRFVLPFSPSIDRIDPNKGYLKSNCRVILMGVNALKGGGTDDDVYEIAENLIKKRGLYGMDKR